MKSVLSANKRAYRESLTAVTIQLELALNILSRAASISKDGIAQPCPFRYSGSESDGNKGTMYVRSVQATVGGLENAFRFQEPVYKSIKNQLDWAMQIGESASSAQDLALTFNDPLTTLLRHWVCSVMKGARNQIDSMRRDRQVVLNKKIGGVPDWQLDHQVYSYLTYTELDFWYSKIVVCESPQPATDCQEPTQPTLLGIYLNQLQSSGVCSEGMSSGFPSTPYPELFFTSFYDNPFFRVVLPKLPVLSSELVEAWWYSEYFKIYDIDLSPLLFSPGLIRMLSGEDDPHHYHD